MSWTIKGNGTGEDLLYSQAGTPSLDLRFASTKSLNDYVSGNNLITFTRASSGTFVGSNGVLRTATTNLLVRSEEFDNASWGLSSIAITPNQIASPSGSATADLITGSAGTATKYLYQQYSASTSGTFTFSVFAKAGTESFVVVRAVDQTGVNEVRQRFNLSSGTLSGSIAVGGTATSGSASIVAFGDGWYRCTVTATFAAFTQLQGNVWLNAYSSTSLTTNFYLWGAQLEQSATVGEYIPTTSTINSAPRFDHNPQTGESLGLLVEEARTNLFLNSEDFSNPTWTLGAVTVTANAVTSPTGATTADSLLETTTNTEHLAYTTSTITFTTATHSIYVKPNGRTNVALRFYHAINDWVATVFNLTGNGSVTQSSAGSSSGFSAVSRSIVNAGNGWYRISMTATQASRAVYISAPDLCTSSTPTLAAGNGSEVYAGDVTKGIYVWGAQLEVGAFPTSYIPTTSATVTRAADAASITGSNFSSWYNQTEGTVFAAYNQPAFGIAIAAIDDGAPSNNSIVLFTSSGANQKASANMLLASANQGRIDAGGTFAPNVLNQAALAVSANGRALSCNGSAVSTNTNPSSMPSLSRLGIQGDNTFVSGKGGTIKRLTYWPTRLVNTTLQTITL